MLGDLRALGASQMIRYAAFFLAAAPSSTPRMSLSFMMSSSSPSSLTSVPDHLPNSTRSPGFTSSGLKLALLVAGAGAYGDDLALLRLLLGGIGDDDAAFGSFVLLDPAYDHAVVQWTKLHG